MPLKDQISADLRRAMLDKDLASREVLRMLKAELTNQEIAVGRELTEADEVAVLKKAVKSREDAARQYEEGGRPEAAENERMEVDIVRRYLPEELSADETRAAIERIASELSLSSKKDMGRLMKELKLRHGPAVNGKLASTIAQEILE